MNILKLQTLMINLISRREGKSKEIWHFCSWRYTKKGLFNFLPLFILLSAYIQAAIAIPGWRTRSYTWDDAPKRRNTRNINDTALCKFSSVLLWLIESNYSRCKSHPTVVHQSKLFATCFNYRYVVFQNLIDEPLHIVSTYAPRVPRLLIGTKADLVKTAITPSKIQEALKASEIFF